MKGPEKDAAMRAFKEGETRVLVATTVVEVGVDVPDATIIVIEHAERFGLAQLHQLRGRVGRSDKPSSCVLLYKGPLGETATRRLQVMRETEDGFRISEEDLKLRGEGELLGTRQSGTPGFRSHASNFTPICWKPLATTPGCCCIAIRTWLRRAAKRSACCSICLGATRRSGC
jgi:ATP-dependent DNA helicase RecG